MTTRSTRRYERPQRSGISTGDAIKVAMWSSFFTVLGLVVVQVAFGALLGLLVAAS